MLEKLLIKTETATRLSALCGGALILAAAALVTADVILRKAFTISMGGADELSGYALAVGSSWAFAYALIRRANIRVDVLYLMLPKRLAALVDLIALVALGTVLAVCTTYALKTLGTTVKLNSHANTPLQTPLVIPQALWVAGFILFLWTFTLLFVESALSLITGNLTKVNELIGTRTIEEDIEEETIQSAEPTNLSAMAPSEKATEAS